MMGLHHSLVLLVFGFAVVNVALASDAISMEEQEREGFFRRWYKRTTEQMTQQMELLQHQVADSYYAPDWEKMMQEESEYFEGWYSRSIAQDGSSVAVVFARFNGGYEEDPRNKNLENGDATSLIVVLVQQPGEQNADVVSWVGPHTKMKLGDMSDSGNPSDFSILVDSPLEYEYVKKPSASHSSLLRALSPANGVASEEEPYLLHAKMTSLNEKQEFELRWQTESSIMSLSMQMEDGIMWNSVGRSPNPASAWGPETFLITMGLSDMHWYVYSVDSVAQAKLTELSTRIDNVRDFIQQQSPEEKVVLEITDGHGHLEKNMGTFFPERWIWLQGIHTDDSTSASGSLVLAGGPMPISGMPNLPNAFLTNFRWCDDSNDESSCLSYGFGPAFSTPFTVDHMIDGCAGVVELTFRDPSRELFVRVSAPPGSFGADFPTPNKQAQLSSEAGAAETFVATATIQAYELDGFGGRNAKRNLIREAEIQHVALEFGGEYRCLEP